MRRLTILFLSVFLIFVFSPNTLATEKYDPEYIQIETTESEASVSIEETEHNTQKEKNETFSFWNICIESLKSITTYIGIGGFLLVGAYMLFFKKEIPKTISALTSCILLILIFFARICVYLPNPDISITLYVIIVYVVSVILLTHFSGKMDGLKQGQTSTKTGAEKRACNEINRIVKNGHSSIKCIQLYSVSEEKSGENTEYNINFLGGCARPKFKVNAMFATTLSIPSTYVDELKTIHSFYMTKVTPDGNLSNSEQTLISHLIEDNIAKLQKELNGISSVDMVTEKECYIARILLLYLSLYAAINEHDAYIGLGRNSLKLSNPNLEAQLFNYERTGILGAILFEKMSYVFSYMKTNSKNGRFYYSFSFGSKRKYVVVITLENKNHGAYINDSLSNTLNSIKDKLRNLLETNDKKEAK